MNVLTSVAPLRYPARELSGRGWTPARLLAGCLISLMWLPAGFYAAGAAGAGGPPWLAGLDGWLYLAGLAPSGVPLVWACGRLRRMGYGGGSYLAFGTLAPAIFVAPFGMLWVWAWAGALSLPAWVPYGLRERARRRRWRNSRRLA